MRAFTWFLLIVVLPLVLLMGVTTVVPVVTEWLWFDSLGLRPVYELRLAMEWGLFWGTALITFLVLVGNVFLARRLAPAEILRVVRPKVQKQQIITETYRIGATVFDFLLWTGAAAVGLIVGLAAQDNWLTVLRFLNRVPFGQTDPIFGRDVGFYVFELPVYWLLKDWALWTLLLALTATAGVYLASRAARAGFPRLARVHLSILGALLFLVLAADWVLQTFGLLNSTFGVVQGAGYTDLHAHLPAFNLMAILSLLAAGVLLLNAVRRVRALPALTLLVWFVAIPVLTLAYPAFVQGFEVGPNELAKEQPYIQYAIQHTRQAYNLGAVAESDYPVTSTLTLEAVERNPGTIRNIRLWDYRPLLQTYRQLQEIRTYYEFTDVDVDRYTLGGEYRAVMIAARELTIDQLPVTARTWVNERLIYTHGYGVCANAVSEVNAEGQPRFLARDLPPVVADESLRMDQPTIYYGESVSDYAIVRTTTPEFDYPRGDENVYVTYQGASGVRLDSALTRLLFALRYESMEIILSGYITPDSRLLMHRVIRDRVRAVAPFLRYDSDPYIVVAGGRLVWIQDAYTVSDMYPYSEATDDFNYIRNSAKVVIDPYTGALTFYVFDPADPLIQAYSRAFPGLFQPMSAFPADLRAHLRYPEGLFTVQAQIFAAYHMDDPQVFYNKEDLWAVPQETAGDTGTLPLEPYYVILRLPGEAKEEFILMLPFTPARRDNMIAWFYARCDGDRYGQLGVFKFPKQELIYGPLQIESRTNQDAVISQQLTLWNQHGSRVIRGNLLVIPIEQSLLYVQPLYLQAETGRIPEFKRVIVAHGNRLAMGETLEGALAQVLGEAGPVVTPPTPPPAGADWAILAKSAKSHYDQAMTCLQAGDWACFGREMAALKSDLEALYNLATAP